MCIICDQSALATYLRRETYAPQDGAIEALVAEKLKERFLFLSANIVNHPLLSHLHARLGAVLPFQAPPAEGSDANAPWALEVGLPPAANVLDNTAASASRCMHTVSPQITQCHNLFQTFDCCRVGCHGTLASMQAASLNRPSHLSVC